MKPIMKCEGRYVQPNKQNNYCAWKCEGCGAASDSPFCKSEDCWFVQLERRRNARLSSRQVKNLLSLVVMAGM